MMTDPVRPPHNPYLFIICCSSYPLFRIGGALQCATQSSIIAFPGFRTFATVLPVSFTTLNAANRDGAAEDAQLLWMNLPALGTHARDEACSFTEPPVAPDVF